MMNHTASRLFRPNVLKLNPLLLLLLWTAAALIVIWAGPMFVPAANSTASVEALVWKAFGASLFLSANLLLLRRTRAGVKVLGLRPTSHNMAWLLAGTVGGIVLVTVCLVLLRTIVQFHFERGTLSAGKLGLSALVYMFGAILEELAFRAYPLLRLRERYGSLKAVLAVALAFGVLHLPGMYGVDALKMVVTTGVCSILFAIAYLRSGTLWTAIGLHAGMNVTLHGVYGGAGAGEASLLVAKFEQQSPPVDAGFWTLTLTLVLVVIALVTLFSERVPSRL